MTQPISMPWSAPAFTPPPHHWQNVRMVVFPFAPHGDVAARILPPGMALDEGPGLITLLSYPHGQIHPFNELVVMLPVRVGETLGNYVPYIYVTTDEALIPGREIAGFPKKIAAVTWERDGAAVRCAAVRWERTILSLEGHVESALPPELAAAQAEAARRPSINYKLIPGPAGDIEVEEITAVDLEVATKEMEIGRARVRCQQSAYDPLAELVPDCEGPMIVMRSDNTIPDGRVLQRIVRGERAA